MDVDATGKGKGKLPTCHACGKTGQYDRDCWCDPAAKGKGKGGGKSKGKSKSGSSGAPEKFAGKCNHCKTTGHKSADCRPRIAEEKQGGAHAVTDDAKGVETIEIASDGDEEDFWCMTLEASSTSPTGRCAAEQGHHCDAVTDTFVTLDTAADGHCGPTWFGDGCAMGPDAGPTLRDAQRQVIDFESVAKVPMVVQTEGGAQLLKASMRLGKTMSKPILSMLGVMDKGADFWLSSKTGLIMYPGGDLAQPIPLERKNNTLGFYVKRFTTTAAARDFANGVEAIGDEDEDREKVLDEQLVRGTPARGRKFCGIGAATET
jgi:hypothetical protein